MENYKMTLSKEAITVNIKKRASEGKRTLEGVIYFDTDYDSYVYTIGVYSIARLIRDNDNIKDLYYFKCTKSGKWEEQQIM